LTAQASFPSGFSVSKSSLTTGIDRTCSLGCEAMFGFELSIGCQDFVIAVWLYPKSRASWLFVAVDGAGL
jgi:hypothetical protein